MTQTPLTGPPAAGTVRFGTASGRWVVAATVLGSGIAFLDGTVVNVALPTIGADLHAGIRELQWILDGYLVTLSALLLLGGSLGDLYGRRRGFLAGLVAFSVASCPAAPPSRLAGIPTTAASVETSAGAKPATPSRPSSVPPASASSDLPEPRCPPRVA